MLHFINLWASIGSVWECVFALQTSNQHSTFLFNRRKNLEKDFKPHYIIRAFLFWGIILLIWSSWFFYMGCFLFALLFFSVFTQYFHFEWTCFIHAAFLFLHFCIRLDNGREHVKWRKWSFLRSENG